MPTLQSCGTRIKLYVSDPDEVAAGASPDARFDQARSTFQMKPLLEDPITDIFDDLDTHLTFLPNPMNINIPFYLSRVETKHIQREQSGYEIKYEALYKTAKTTTPLVPAKRGLFSSPKTPDSTLGRDSRPLKRPKSAHFIDKSMTPLPVFTEEKPDTADPKTPTFEKSLKFTPVSTITTSSSEPMSDNSERTKSPNAPETWALTLVVSLSKKAFYLGFNSNALHHSVNHSVVPGISAEDQGLNDLKIDVFYNGDFCHSSLVSARLGQRITKAHDQHIECFTGRRISRRSEKPWILVPPSSAAEDESRLGSQAHVTETGSPIPVHSHSVHKHRDWSRMPVYRWADISSALRTEAGNWCTCKDGSPSLISTYLTSLASLPLPPALATDLSENFGVIDVVVISGYGRKDEVKAGYLLEPVRLRVGGQCPPINLSFEEFQQQVLQDKTDPWRFAGKKHPKFRAQGTGSVKHFVMPLLSQGSICTYIEETGVSGTRFKFDDTKGSWRGVPSERSGWFEEKEVLCSARFVIS